MIPAKAGYHFLGNRQMEPFSLKEMFAGVMFVGRRAVSS
jgi:hypothetical protein